MKLTINGKAFEIDEAWEQETLLACLRDALGLTGTKFGCGLGLCGACTVHLNGQAARACQLTVADIQGQQITTIEGLATESTLHPVQQAWIDESVPQCGYCQPGQIMAAAALLAQQPDPSIEEVSSAMAGNLCRCGTYPRIRRGVMRAARIIREKS